uniref:Olfactory receptor 89 n=1 Tax=Aulacocentrum confusum TaxID=2767324 RepID=A0A7G8Z9A8_9HYME|nr:olfactory receptor 89 [Aulacocentrum confusum]
MLNINRFTIIIIFLGDSDNLFELPFRIRIFFTVNDTLTYYLVYFYQFPMVYLLICHNAWICLLITIVLHICGQLAIVEYRIRHIKMLPGARDNTNTIFRELVERHMRSIWMAKASDDAFHFVLLLDLVGTTLLLGLMSYVVIIGSSMSESSFGYVYIICVIATVFLLYGYCIVGELLIQESKRVHAAYYECLWYESSITFRKSLMICMTQTQEPLRMTAGKFFVFSLTGFTDVLRSAMGYLSMLRKMTH